MEALKMENSRDSWNDGRLDELSRRVDDGFLQVDKRFKQVDKRFEQVATKAEVAELRADFRLLLDKFDNLMRALMVVGLTFGITAFAALSGMIVALIGAS